MINVRTDHYVHADGLDKMALTDGEGGTVLVTATLVDGDGPTQVWLIEAPGQTAATAGTRTLAIETMGNMSLLVLGISGASLYVPPEVVALP